MYIKDIRIRNFKSIYGEQYFNFVELDGLVKLSGVIGSGKTTLCEALLYGLFGNVNGHKIPNLVSWNEKECQVEMNIISRNKEIRIVRSNLNPLIVEVNGHLIAASNKRDTQEILELEYFDVPRLAIERMCIISFNAFNSLASMNPGQTKQFLDEVFGFQTFTNMNNIVVNERKLQVNENTKLQAIYEDTQKQITYLNEKKIRQQEELSKTVDISGCSEEREKLVEQGKKHKEDFENTKSSYAEKIAEINKQKLDIYNKKMEFATLGKQEKEYVNTFKSGKCPTCGQDIDMNTVEEHKNRMMNYATEYKKYDAQENDLLNDIRKLENDRDQELQNLKNKMDNLKQRIYDIDNKVNNYNNSMQLIKENYDDLICEYETKLQSLKEQIDKLDIEIGEWNDMNELFTKTLRYNLLETLIPHINKSIQYFINKLDQNYKIEYDQEFKPHIHIDTYDKEISYKDLSTGQRKSLDLAIIFGILQNIIANVNFNLFCLDELFSNMDAESRNTMLTVLKETMVKDRTIFVINHAEMSDDYFNHKVQVKLVNKKIKSGSGKKEKEFIVKASHYEQSF
jgi:DNA repair exonuclease SbcCD ATPase subunit